MFSKTSFNLLVVSNTTPFFTVVQIIYFHDCRITKDTSTLIDVILTNDPSHVAFSSIPPQVYKTNKNKIH